MGEIITKEFFISDYDINDCFDSAVYDPIKKDYVQDIIIPKEIKKVVNLKIVK